MLMYPFLQKNTDENRPFTNKFFYLFFIRFSTIWSHTLTNIHGMKKKRLKITGAFRLYDVDNDGFITRDEMYNIVDAIYQVKFTRNYYIRWHFFLAYGYRCIFIDFDEYIIIVIFLKFFIFFNWMICNLSDGGKCNIFLKFQWVSIMNPSSFENIPSIMMLFIHVKDIMWSMQMIYAMSFTTWN